MNWKQMNDLKQPEPYLSEHQDVIRHSNCCLSRLDRIGLDLGYCSAGCVVQSLSVLHFKVHSRCNPFIIKCNACIWLNYTFSYSSGLHWLCQLKEMAQRLEACQFWKTKRPEHIIKSLKYVERSIKKWKKIMIVKYKVRKHKLS